MSQFIRLLGIFALTLLTTLATTVFASDADIVKEANENLTKLAATTAQSAKACAEFSNSVTAVLKEGKKLEPPKSGVIPKDKASYDKLLATLKTFPGTNAAASSIVQIVRNLSTFAELDIDPKPVTAINVCATGSLFEAYLALINGADEYKLPPAKKAEIASLFFTQASQELTKIASSVNLLLFNGIALELVDARFLAVSDPIYLSLVQFEERADFLRDQIREKYHIKDPKDMKEVDKMSSAEKRIYWRNLSFELVQASRIGTQMARVFKRLSK